MNKYLKRISDFAETLIEHGADCYGPVSSPLFAGTIMTGNNRMPTGFLDSLPGTRAGDRCLHGNNLMHDLPLIKAFQALSDLTGNNSYAKAVKDYLDFYFENCPDPVTGLFPWGEHVFWHFWYEKPYTYATLFEDIIIHDHLRAAPPWFWAEAAKRNPEVVRKFGMGLLRHVWNKDTFMYSRHALMNTEKMTSGTFNFPRHAGFYIVDWCCAYNTVKDPAFLEFCDSIVEHHLSRRHSEYKYLKLCDHHPSATPECVLAQNSSLALSLFDAADTLDESQEKRKKLWREFAAELALAFIGHVWNSREEKIYSKVEFATSRPLESPNIWQSSYGKALACDLAVHSLGLFRHIRDKRFLDFAGNVLEVYRNTPLPSVNRTFKSHSYFNVVPAHDFGSFLNLEVDYADITGKNNWTHAIAAADLAIEQLTPAGKSWFTAGTATGVPWYESGLDVARVVYSLVRLGAAVDGKIASVPPDYQWR